MPQGSNITLDHVETNRSEGDFSFANDGESTFDSLALVALPDPFLAEDYDAADFSYNKYPLTNEGNDSDWWDDNNYNAGFGGLARITVGGLYFSESVVAQSQIPTANVFPVCTYEDIKPRVFWDYISTFFNFLDDKTIDVFEGYWSGMSIAGGAMMRKALRFLGVTAPEETNECISEDYYQVQLGPLYSKPTNLNPVSQEPNFNITPIDIIISEVDYSDINTPEYSDIILISARDYYKIREIGIGTYLIAKSKDNSIADKVFNIINLMSSEEDESGDRYYPRSGEAGDASKYNYAIKTNGDLAYLRTASFTIHLTTGRAYDIDPNIKILPTLQNYVLSGKGALFYDNEDYTLDNSTLEFNDDIFKSHSVDMGDIVYSKHTPALEHMLYDMYGSLISIPDGNRYNYNNATGKAGVNSLLDSLQNASGRKEYEDTIKTYYGMPQAPDKSTVHGLYESYGYEVLGINSNIVLLKIPTGTSLHPFVRKYSEMLLEGYGNITVSDISDDERSAGIINVVDVGPLKVGDKLYLKLVNKMEVSDVVSSSPTENATITVKYKEGPAGIKHLIDTVNGISNGLEYPEILVYDTNTETGGFNGTYHITDAYIIEGALAGNVTLEIYKPEEGKVPVYNDFINGNDYTDLDSGFVHIMWPTHKFLYTLVDKRYYLKMFLDAPIDTIYDAGDSLDKYQHIDRNVSIIDNSIFSHWNEFDNFRHFNNVHNKSTLVELTSVIPGAKFGRYFPSSYIEK